MTTTTVLFEDVEPFADLYFPITFQVVVDYSTLTRWDVDTYEARGARGGWVKVQREHALWQTLYHYVTSDHGYEVIEDQIDQEIRSNRLAA